MQNPTLSSRIQTNNRRSAERYQRSMPLDGFKQWAYLTSPSGTKPQWMLKFIVRKFAYGKGIELHRYLAARKSDLISKSTTTYRLSTILMAMKQIIEEERLNKNNYGILYLNEGLAKIFGTSTTHISTIRTQIESMLYDQEGYCEKAVDAEMEEAEYKAMLFWKRQEMATGAKPRRYFDFGQRYMLHDKLTIILTDAGIIKRPNRAYWYGQIYQMILTYLENNLGTSNPGIYAVYNDPIGKFFNVEYMYKCEMHSLIQKSLIPTTPRRKEANQTKIPYVYLLSDRRARL